ncbi:MAG TPA: hypothetical protein VD995_27270 [Azospirillum sp.]|nr:hypothetical protein [Azospirillum sp.]
MEKHDVEANIRLSIVRHGSCGWRWTMLLTTDEDTDFAVAAEFRTGEDGRGTWMRLIGEPEEAWTLVTPPERRSYPADPEAARSEIEQVCVAAATDLVRAHRGERPSAGPHGELAAMRPMGTC